MNETNTVVPVAKVPSIRERALEWFFAKNETEKMDLKAKHYSDAYIAYSEQWGFHFTFGQIEEMYEKEVDANL